MSMYTCETTAVAIYNFYKQPLTHMKPRRCSVFVQGEMVKIIPVTGLDVLLCFPVSPVLLDSDINAYSSRRGGGINLEGTEHGIVEATMVLGSSSPSDSCDGIILALILVLLGITAQETSDRGNDDREVAHGQGHTGLERADDSLPNTGEAKDQDGVGEGGDGGSQ